MQFHLDLASGVNPYFQDRLTILYQSHTKNNEDHKSTEDWVYIPSNVANTKI